MWSPDSFGVSVIDRWLVRLRIARRATHRARAEALERRTLVGVHRDDRAGRRRRSSWLCSALATADSQQLAASRAATCAGCGRGSRGLLDRLAADVVADEPRLAGGRADVLGVRADDRRARPAHRPPCAGFVGRLGRFGPARRRLGLLVGARARVRWLRGRLSALRGAGFASAGRTACRRRPSAGGLLGCWPCGALASRPRLRRLGAPLLPLAWSFLGSAQSS